MREIKFRAWAKEEHEMIQANTLAFEEYAPLGCLLNDGDDLIIMQYTGLKDKNGKEIYEGDIIKLPEDGEEKIYYIKYSQNRLGFTLNNGCGFALAYGIEVIGNIYENSELLEGNHE